MLTKKLSALPEHAAGIEHRTRRVGEEILGNERIVPSSGWHDHDGQLWGIKSGSRRQG
jgi:hypothetical protein